MRNLVEVFARGGGTGFAALTRDNESEEEDYPGDVDGSLGLDVVGINSTVPVFRYVADNLWFACCFPQ